MPVAPCFAATDQTLIQACQREGRCLVSLDLDFANPLLFNPAEFSGIAVIRLPGKPSREDILRALRTLASGLDASDIAGKLWIIQPGRIREYQQET